MAIKRITPHQASQGYWISLYHSRPVPTRLLPSRLGGGVSQAFRHEPELFFLEVDGLPPTRTKSTSTILHQPIDKVIYHKLKIRPSGPTNTRPIKSHPLSNKKHQTLTERL